MYITPEISKEEAYTTFSHKKIFLPLKLLTRPVVIKRIELIYLPFYVFDIILTGKSGNPKVTIALDGLLGNMIFFIKDDFNYRNTSKHPTCDFILSGSEAREIALKEYKWLLLEQGLRNRRTLTIEKIAEARKIFYPFWIGYIQKRKGYEFKALDALSGQLQGIKMRRVFLQAFRKLG